MSNITNRQVVCNALMEEAQIDKSIVVACSDSRGSASLSDFAVNFPDQFVEVGIAEQNLVTISAGLASCGKKVFAASPASFLSTRSYEQVKVDVAYSKENVKLLGISGGVSYGALGMTHHSCQDIAAMAALPDMRVYFPSDRFLTNKLMKCLIKDDKPAYIRLSRNATKDVYSDDISFEMNKSITVKSGKDAAIIACGEMVPEAVEAAEILQDKGIEVAVIDMYCIKPIDEEAIIKAAQNCKFIVTVEEHSIYGGLGSIVSQIASANAPVKVVQLALPDSHMIAGSEQEIFKEYGLDAAGIANTVEKELRG